MSNRRDFLRTAGHATVGAWLAGGALPGLAQSARRDVTVGGEPVTIVDIHAHCVFAEVADILPEGMPTPFNPGFPGLTLGPDRLEVMDARGIDIQALSVNNYWWYAQDRDLAARIVRVHDEGLAEWCAMYPDRFVALSSVALQFPDLAAEQLEYAVNELDHRGASIGGHVANEPPTTPEYDVFWAKVEELGVPIFMHPNNATNVVREGGLAGPRQSRQYRR